MDYYQLFDIAPSPIIDKQIAKKNYLLLSRKYHPDLVDNTNETEVEEAMNISSNINKAYTLFTNPSLSIQYYLQYKNIIVEDEKYPLPNDFLMDMMDINELLEDAKSANDQTALSNVTNQILQLDSALYDEIKPILETEIPAEMSENSLQSLKEYYYKTKYIHRILDGIS